MGDEDVLELDRGDGCVRLICTLQMNKMVNFVLCVLPKRKLIVHSISLTDGRLSAQRTVLEAQY